MRAEKMRHAVLLGVVVFTAIVVMVQDRTIELAGVSAAAAKQLTDAFTDLLKVTPRDTKVAATLKTGFKTAAEGGDAATLNKLLNDVVDKADSIGAASTTHLKNLREQITKLAPPPTLANLDAAIQANEKLLKTPAVRKELGRQLGIIVEKVDDPGLKAFIKNPAKGASADVLKKLDDWARTASDADRHVMYLHIKNPVAKKNIIASVAAKKGIQIEKTRKAVNNTPKKQQDAIVRVQQEVIENVGNTVPEVVEKAVMGDVLKTLSRNERIGWAFAGFGIVAGVVGTIVAILVKPPYWNDTAVMDGTGGATPGQQPGVDFINWLNENPTAFTMSSCMSCLCCCCCCVVMIMALAGGGTKGGNDLSF